MTITHTCTVGPSAVTGERCGRPAVTSFTTRTGEILYECETHAPAERATVPSPAVTKLRHSGPRRKLTKHQAAVLLDLERRSGWRRGSEARWVDLRSIGSKQGLLHLVDKGYAEVRTTYGPRGGELLSFRPI